MSKSQLIIGRDKNGNVTYGLNFPADTEQAVKFALLASTAVAVTVPAWASVAIFTFNSGANVWVDDKNTATLPTLTVTGTTSELNPIVRNVKPGSTISLITDVNAIANIVFYPDPRNQNGI